MLDNQENARMDELLFRSSQKIENLQIQLALTAQQSQELFHRYFEQGLSSARELCRSPAFSNLQELAKDLLRWVVETAERTADLVLDNLVPRRIFDEFLKVFRNRITKQQFYCGCAGFFLGVLAGYSYAVLTHKYGRDTSAPQMQAAACTSYDGIQFASLIEDLPLPKVVDYDDVLVQVKASSVCAIDVEICRGYGRRVRRLLNKYSNFSRSEFPVILGRSCAGIVLEIGQGVTRVDIGDEVYLTAPYWAHGTTSQLTLTKEHRVTHKPTRIGFEYSAGLPYAGSQALILMQTVGINRQNSTDKRILIIGGCTPVGCILIQYCHLLNTDITVVTSTRAAPAAKALGADDILIFQDQVTSKSELEIDQTRLLHKELQLRELFDIVFVTMDAGLSRKQLKQLCKNDGEVAYSLPKCISSDSYGFIAGCLYSNYIRVKCCLQNLFGWQRSGFGELEIDYEYLDSLSELVDKNQLQSVIDKVFLPQDIERALEHAEAPDSIGSTIITFR